MPNLNTSLDGVLAAGEADMDKKGIVDDQNADNAGSGAGDADNAGADNEPAAPATPAETATPDPLEAMRGDIDGLGKTLTDLTRTLEDKLSNIPAAPAADDADDDKDAWKPKVWGDVEKKIEETADQIADRKLKEKEDNEKAAIARKDAELKRINDDFDNQVSQLDKAGVLPKDADAKKKFTKELFGYAAHLDTFDLVKTADTIVEMNALGKHFDFKSRKWIAPVSKSTIEGRTTPVGASGTRGIDMSVKPTQKQIRGSSLDELARRAQQG